jgi:hypothetical protein
MKVSGAGMKLLEEDEVKRQGLGSKRSETQVFSG